MTSGGALIIFAKSPVPGQVKTRLISGIGRRRATSLYQDLLTRTLNTARKAGFSEIHVWVNGDVGHRYFTRLKNRHYVKLYHQKGKDLGQRMFNAFDTVLRKYPYAVLIGSDCPSLSSSDLQLATEYLENKSDVVLGPADDGGYYLIGLRKNNPRLFSGIGWGKEKVFTDTCSHINDLNWDIRLLSRRWDVDRTTDLLPYFRMKRKESVLYY
jgi:uncharacterized protein